MAVDDAGGDEVVIVEPAPEPSAKATMAGASIGSFMLAFLDVPANRAAGMASSNVASPA